MSQHSLKTTLLKASASHRAGTLSTPPCHIAMQSLESSTRRSPHPASVIILHTYQQLLSNSDRDALMMASNAVTIMLAASANLMHSRAATAPQQYGSTSVTNFEFKSFSFQTTTRRFVQTSLPIKLANVDRMASGVLTTIKFYCALL